MNSAQPGWYPDQTGTLRWWNGREWTEYTHPPQAPHPQAAPQAPQEPTHQLHSPVEPAAASQPARTAERPRLRHRGVAWSLAGLVLLAMLGSGGALAVAASTRTSAVESASGDSPKAPAEADAAEGAQDGADSEGPEPLYPVNPVSDREAKRLEAGVQQYNDALNSQDCAAYEAITTPELRSREACSVEMLKRLEKSDLKSKTLRTSSARPGLYELRAEETFTRAGETVVRRYAYVLIANDAGDPVVDIIFDRN